MNIVFHDRMLHRFAPVIAILMAGLIAVESSAQITILEPRAGSDYERGDNLTIRWECRGATMSTEWDVKLIFDDGREHVDGDIVKWRENWSRVRRSLEGDRLVCSVHNVHLGNWFSVDDYAVEVKGTGGFVDSPTDEQVERSESFRLNEGRWLDVRVTPGPSPAAWVSQKYTVSWTSHNITNPITLKITVPSFNSLTPTTEVLASRQPIAGSFEWTAAQGRLIGPDLPNPDVRRFILDNGEVEAKSRPFTVQNPDIFVTQPIAGARWHADREQTVRWDAPMLDGDVTIKLMQEEDDGRLVLYETIAERTANDGERKFTLFPQEPFVGSPRTTISTLRIVVESADRPPPFREPARGQSAIFTMTELSY